MILMISKISVALSGCPSLFPDLLFVIWENAVRQILLWSPLCRWRHRFMEREEKELPKEPWWAELGSGLGSSDVGLGTSPLLSTCLSRWRAKWDLSFHTHDILKETELWRQRSDSKKNSWKKTSGWQRSRARTRWFKGAVQGKFGVIELLQICTWWHLQSFMYLKRL